jgi:hypothetical protein
VVGAVRQAIALEHELEVYAVLLLKTGSILKTSSGKISAKLVGLARWKPRYSRNGLQTKLQKRTEETPSHLCTLHRKSALPLLMLQHKIKVESELQT